MVYNHIKCSSVPFWSYCSQKVRISIFFQVCRHRFPSSI